MPPTNPAVHKFKKHLASTLSRRTFIVYVARENDMQSLRLSRPGKWTVPKAAKPGDRLVFYKPGRGKGWAGTTKPPYEVFVGVGVVHEMPRSVEPRRYQALVGELVVFPNPVHRRALAAAFCEWRWLCAPQAPSGAQVPLELDADLLAFLGRKALYPKD